MISDNEFLEIIQGLFDKTAKENLHWQLGKAGDPAYVASASAAVQRRQHASEGYSLKMPKSVIEIRYATPSAEPDYIDFTIARDPGAEVLATRRVYEGDFGWVRLSDLYSLIRRRALGWDDVLKSVREFLGKPSAPVATSQKGP